MSATTNSTGYTIHRVTRQSMLDQAEALRCEMELLRKAARDLGRPEASAKRSVAWRKLEQDLKATEAWLANFGGDEWWVVISPDGQVCDGPCEQRKAERLADEMNEGAW